MPDPTMKQVVISRFGGPEVLEVVESAVPRPGAGEVSVDVSHAAVGLADVLMRQGAFGGEPPLVPGLEVAGTVREVGAGVDTLQAGEPVVTLSRPSAGGYAEVSVAAAGVTVSLADSALDPAAAVATVPNAATAVLALTTVARLAEGERLLVNGAHGALGATLTQVGRALGAGRVVGSGRTSEPAPGTDQMLTTEDLTRSESAELGGPFDVVIDPVGGEVRRASLAALAPLGRLICVGDASGADDVTVGGTELWLANHGVLGLNMGGLLAERPDIGGPPAQRALELIADGSVATAYRTMPLAEAADAHRRLERGGLRERLVLTV